MMERSVVVTGIGAVSPLGNTAEASWYAALEGHSGISTITKFNPTGLDSQIAGQINGLDLFAHFSRRDLRRMDLASAYALVAAREALTCFEFGNADPWRAGVIIGTGLGGVSSLVQQTRVILERGARRVDPLMIPRVLADSPASLVSMDTGFKGPSMGLSAACATGAAAIGEAFEMIHSGRCDTVLCGATDAAIIQEIVAGFCSIKALSRRNAEPERASRPFDVSRDGFVIAEGAAMLLLELEKQAVARGAPILARLAGYGHTADAFHITAPAPDGEAAARAMSEAINQAHLSSDDVDYVNAHGTSTVLNDVSETRAIKKALGSHAFSVPTSSTKSVTGHLLGAAGALEAVFCIQALRDQCIPPTMNLDESDPQCDLDYVPNEARRVRLDAVLSNSSGFGGHNTALVFVR